MQNGELIIPEEFYLEEERDGYLVSSKMKKVWAIELTLLHKLDCICKKHGLSYFLEYGSLLGAVRHKGFIPWDDDIDVVMFRDDYEKLKVIAQDELEEPFVFQNAYNGIILWGFSKIRYSGTSAVEHPDADPSFHQGIFLDIFPMDDAMDEDSAHAPAVRMAAELWTILNSPRSAMELIPKHAHRVMDDDMLSLFCQMPQRQVFSFMEQYLLSAYGKSTKVNYIVDEILNLNPSVDRKDFEQVLEVPFEMLTVPIPAGYDRILRKQYGDYTIPVQGGSCHSDIILDPDQSYEIYLSKNGE